MRVSNQKTRNATYLHLFGRLLSFYLLDLNLLYHLLRLDIRDGLCDTANADLHLLLRLSHGGTASLAH